MDGSGHDELQKRRRLKTTALLWGIAAALALIAFALQTIDTGRVRAIQAIVAGTFTLMAFVSYRRARRGA